MRGDYGGRTQRNWFPPLKEGLIVFKLQLNGGKAIKVSSRDEKGGKVECGRVSKSSSDLLGIPVELGFLR